jgi:hypothetical protein
MSLSFASLAQNRAGDPINSPSRRRNHAATVAYVSTLYDGRMVLPEHSVTSSALTGADRFADRQRDRASRIFAAIPRTMKDRMIFRAGSAMSIRFSIQSERHCRRNLWHPERIAVCTRNRRPAVLALRVAATAASRNSARRPNQRISLSIQVMNNIEMTANRTDK